MDDSESFHSRHRHHLSSTLSQLLFCNELDDHNPIGDDDQSFTYSSGSPFNAEKQPKMLRFGGEMDLFGSDKSGVTTCKDSTISASLPVSVTNRGSSSNKRKTRLENPSSGGKTRVREGGREKLGDRINELQQLVSPFGKTDTASVLHEAMGYIRFLQEQVQVLCSPYLQHQHNVEQCGEEPIRNLRSRGLCLVPLECTVHVASSNWADYWSPGGMINHVVSQVVTGFSASLAFCKLFKIR